MSERSPRYHEIISPVRELVQQLGEWAVGKTIFRESVDHLVQPPQRAEQQQLPFEE